MARTTIGLLCGFLAALLPLSPSLAADRTAAKDFLDKIYALYRGENAGGVPYDKRTDEYFTPALAAMIAKDSEQAAAAGEVPRLDGDPFVDAQDWSIEDVDIAVAPTQSPDQANATVSFKTFGEARTIRLDLIHLETAGWRIDDIRSDDGDSLRELLTVERE